MEPLTAYIEHPELLTAEVVNELAEMVERNPSFQAARLLLVKGLYQLQSERFGAELRKAALQVPDRSVLYYLLEDGRMQLNQGASTRKPRRAASSSADRTQSLIESFLEQQPEAPQPRKVHPVDASVDYMAYLMQQPDADVLPDASEAELEDEDMSDDGQEGLGDIQKPQSETQNTDQPINDPYFTETLAHIFIKQGKYSKAIEIIRRLSLNYPKKNRYFADQIRFLEILIINERNNHSENK